MVFCINGEPERFRKERKREGELLGNKKEEKKKKSNEITYEEEKEQKRKAEGVLLC